MSIQSSIRGNITKSYFIMAVFIAFVVVVGYVMGQALGYGNGFLWIAVLFAVISSFFGY